MLFVYHQVQVLLYERIQPVVITGFGLTQEDGSLPYNLQQAIIQLLPTCGRCLFIV